MLIIYYTGLLSLGTTPEGNPCVENESTVDAHVPALASKTENTPISIAPSFTMNHPANLHPVHLFSVKRSQTLRMPLGSLAVFQRWDLPCQTTEPLRKPNLNPQRNYTRSPCHASSSSSRNYTRLNLACSFRLAGLLFAQFYTASTVFFVLHHAYFLCKNHLHKTLYNIHFLIRELHVNIQKICVNF